VNLHFRIPFVAVLAALGGCADADRVTVMTVLNHGNCQTTTTGVQMIDYEAVAQLRGARLIGMSNEPAAATPALHLIAILPGEFPTTGYSIHLDGAAPELTDPLVLRITVQPPPKEAVLAQVMTRPCLVVGIDNPAVKRLRVIDAKDAVLGEVDLGAAASNPNGDASR
jgi:hypothetical protein